jgi:hypothetical protein
MVNGVGSANNQAGGPTGVEYLKIDSFLDAADLAAPSTHNMVSIYIHIYTYMYIYTYLCIYIYIYTNV